MWELIIGTCVLYYLLYEVLLLRPNKSHLTCGIFGFNGNKDGPPADETKIRWLAMENQSRGKDSTGLYSIKGDKKGTQSFLRKVQAVEFILDWDSDGFNSIIKGAYNLGGHTRSASVGAVSLSNTHPFEFGETLPRKNSTLEHVVGAHNGFLVEWEKQRDQFKVESILPDFPTDSMVLFAALAKNGGDYKILSKIEGAIATWFILPKKYPDITFLYRREARPLALGWSKEGIYFSSTNDSLKFIGCREVAQIPENHLILLKDGDVYDIVEMPLPKIKIPTNATRHSWKSFNKLEDYKHLCPDEEKEHKYMGMLNKFSCSNHNRLPFTTHDTSDDVDDLLGVVLKDIEKDVNKLEVVEVPFSVSREKSIEELDAGIVALKILASPHKSPLGGYLVWDNDDPTLVNSATMLNGVSVLEYPPSACHKERIIKLSDPINGEFLFQHKIKPVAGSVLEVTLILPFPQEDVSTANRCKDRESGSDFVKIIKIADDKSDRSTFVDEQGKSSKLSVSKDIHNVLKPSEPIQIRHTEQKIHECGGGQKSIGAGSMVSGIKAIVDKKARDLHIKNLPQFMPLSEMSEIIQEENATFKFNSQIKKLRTTREWTSSIRWFGERLASVINISLLMHESAVLKMHKTVTAPLGACSLSFYAIQLLEFGSDYYSITKKQLDDDQRALVRSFCEWFRAGMPDDGHEKKALDNYYTLNKKKLIASAETERLGYPVEWLTR